MLRPFLEEVEQRVLVCDGAMGTMLYSKGIFLNRSFEELNLSQPDLVAEIHQAYVQAGAEVLETNTFGANRIKLAAFGLADRLHAINVQGVRIARHAARERAYVAGSIGPLGIRVEPWGKTGLDEAEAYFREQAAALLDGGVDLFILETFRDLNELLAAIRAVKSLCSLPVVAQMTTEEDGNSLDGTPPESFAPALEAAGADLVGVNCSVGPAPMLETIERIAGVTRARLSAQPNAGKPRDVDGRNLYLCSPEYMASYARRFIAHGVRLVGGCCGTTPEHIRRIKLAVCATAPAPPRAPGAAARDGSAAIVVTEPAAPPVAREEKSRLAHALARGKFAVLVELEPPRGFRCDHVLEQARLLKIYGVDAVLIPEAVGGAARMSALAVAVLVEQQAGLETVLQYACRNRVLLGMQTDLLGAHALGVRNVLLVTGEPRRVGDYPDASGVFDVDSIGLTNAVARLNRGLDIGGRPMGSTTAFHIGVAANPSAVDLEYELRRLAYKVEAGAEFAVTPPVYDLRVLDTFLRRIEAFRIPVIAGVRPFISLRDAEFLANEIPGLAVPPELVERMRRLDTPEAALREGVSIARELATALASRVQGLQLVPPGGNLAPVLQVLESL
jgi:methionine synthase I (cobalamin-dependent)/5,10-methylenetetrahydrofolate reductase